MTEDKTPPEPEPPKPPAKVDKWKKINIPTYWRPEPGQSVTGTFVERKWKQGPNGEYEVLILNTGSGLVAVAGCVLMSLLDALGTIQKDTQIKVTYNGIITATNGNPVKDLELFVMVK